MNSQRVEELRDSLKQNLDRTAEELRSRLERAHAALDDETLFPLERAELKDQIDGLKDRLDHLYRPMQSFETSVRRSDHIAHLSGETIEHLTRNDTNNCGKARKRTTTRDIKVKGTKSLTSVNGASSLVAIDEMMQNFSNKPPTLYVNVRSQECSDCSGKVAQTTHGPCCVECGTVQDTFIVDTQNSDDCLEYTSFSYRRIQHFSDWLSSFQARENVQIPEEVLRKLMEVLYYYHNVSVPEKITPALVRTALKQLNSSKENKFHKYYDNSVLISCLLSGKTPPRLTPQQETMLKNMFSAIQPAFEEHKSKDRKNFLSYSYVLYKLCQLAGLDVYLSYFPLLKSEKKKNNLDQVWKKMMKSLNWKFIPS